MTDAERGRYWRLWSRSLLSGNVSGWSPWETVFESEADGTLTVGGTPAWRSVAELHEWVLLPVGVVPAKGVADHPRGETEIRFADGTVEVVRLW